MLYTLLCCFKPRSKDAYYAPCQPGVGSDLGTGSTATPSTEGVSSRPADPALPQPLRGPLEPCPLDLQICATEGMQSTPAALCQRQASSLALSATPRVSLSSQPESTVVPSKEDVIPLSTKPEEAFTSLQLSQAGSQADDLEEVSI